MSGADRRHDTLTCPGDESRSGGDRWCLGWAVAAELLAVGSTSETDVRHRGKPFSSSREAERPSRFDQKNPQWFI